eukprot:TRINITY_DN5645_c0_g1_i14.p1 TRINITY_DN5645_c0_g1~~TRINITY_DN5645_c0_g1_i14.p1  ORF type:complete len:103 (-),score=8.96 TRINITY_DN5645_c0_g1_i14:894-1202(-)
MFVNVFCIIFAVGCTLWFCLVVGLVVLHVSMWFLIGVFFFFFFFFFFFIFFFFVYYKNLLNTQNYQIISIFPSPKHHCPRGVPVTGPSIKRKVRVDSFSPFL